MSVKEKEPKKKGSEHSLSGRVKAIARPRPKNK